MTRGTGRPQDHGRSRPPRRAIAAVGVLLMILTVSATAPPDDPGGASPVTGDAGAVALEVTTVLDDLDRSWDLAFTPDGTMLVTERDREHVVALQDDGTRSLVLDEPRGVWHNLETGMMGIAVSPDFEDDREIFVCHGWRQGESKDVRVTAWRVDEDYAGAERRGVVVKGIFIGGGKHAGCRVRFSPDGALWISTGDARTGPLPQDKRSLNGKILRVDPVTGAGWPTNPWADAADRDKRRVYTYGHRNAQGLAWRDLGGGDGEMWSVEQGTTIDDEVNQLQPGGNYGWDPMPDYFADAPMTDHSIPGRQIDARWSSGETIATSGATWITHPRWGPWQGRLAVGTTQAMELDVMEFTRRGRLVGVVVPPELDGPYGDLRQPVQGPDGALYLTTDNGAGEQPGVDRVIRVVPAG